MRRDDTDSGPGTGIEEWTPINDPAIRIHNERCMLVFKWGRWLLWYSFPLIVEVLRYVEGGGSPDNFDIPPPIVNCAEVPECPPCPSPSLICPPWPDGETPPPLKMESPPR